MPEESIGGAGGSDRGEDREAAEIRRPEAPPPWAGGPPGEPAGPGEAPLPRVTALAVAFFALAALAPVPLLGIGPLALAAFVYLGWRLRRCAGPSGLDHDPHLVRAGLAVWGLGLLLLGLAAAVAVTSPPPLGREGGGLAEPGEAGIPWVAIPILILAVLAHECAHGLAALWSGDPTARDQGRLTLNPLAHIDPVGSVFVPALLVLTKADFVVGWARPVPLAVQRLRHGKFGPLAVALAGPSANVALGLGCLGLLGATGCALRLAGGVEASGLIPLERAAAIAGTGLDGPLALGVEILKWGFLVNVALAVFNLMPVPPLDGSWILEGLLPGPLARGMRRLRRFGLLLVLVLLAAGLLEYLLYPIILALAVLAAPLVLLFYGL